MKRLMYTRDVFLSLVMVASSFVLVYSHLEALDRTDPVQIASAVLLIAAMALLMLSTSTRLSMVEQELEASQRAMRIGLQGWKGRWTTPTSGTWQQWRIYPRSSTGNVIWA